MPASHPPSVRYIRYKLQGHAGGIQPEGCRNAVAPAPLLVRLLA